MDERFDDVKIKMQQNNPTKVSWNKSYSPYGYRLSEVISAMGKEIRRGQEELSAFWAYQMMISGSYAEQFLWERFKIISIEDVGLADPNAIVRITATKELYYELQERTFDRYATGVFSAVYLARCPKTRYTHELSEDIVDRLHEGTFRPEIPDYALDIHLPHARRDLGRDKLHYLLEGAKLKNENLSLPKIHRDRIIARAKKESESK